MAKNYTKIAAKQVNPVFNPQIAQLRGQIPQIQNLYQQLSQGLTQQNEAQLSSGVQAINEDASARGVLRSTLPTDSRTALQGQLGAALTQSLGQLGIEQLGAVNDIQERIGQAQLSRFDAIQSLASALQQRSLAERQFKLDKQISLMNAANSGSGSSGSLPQWQLNQQALQLVAGKWSPGKDSYVNPAQWNNLRKQWQAGGFDVKTFDDQFSNLINPAYFNPDKKDYFKKRNVSPYTINKSLRDSIIKQYG